VSTRQEEIERLAALALAPLVEVAWADGTVTPGERQGVLEAAKSIGLDRNSEFCRTTLRRWLHEAPPTEALEEWRQLLASTLSRSTAHAARKSEMRLIEEARKIAKMDERPFEVGASLDARAGITDEEQHVLDDLVSALGGLASDD
jgi:tellurite resistance protein